MQGKPYGKIDSLEALAKAHFKREFSTAEHNLLASAPLGRLAYCGPSNDPTNPGNDPSKAESWEHGREIAADLIRWLCVDRKTREQVDPVGILIQAAKITSNLDLEFVVVPFPIRLWNCALPSDAALVQAEIPRLDLGGSWTKYIFADGAIVKGDVFLNNGFHSDGSVRFVGAQIGGDLECEGGTFSNRGGTALLADRAIVKGGIFLTRGFYSDGSVRLLSAQVGGNLECSGGTFNNLGGRALDADGIIVKGTVFLRNSFNSNGAVWLLRAKIGVNLDCDGGTFVNAGGQALYADDALVNGNVFLRQGFSAKGIITLRGAHIEGDLNCTGGVLSVLADATLDLRYASASSIHDDPNSWPQPGNLLLDGFVYERIAEGPRGAEPRLKWLALQPHQKPFATQPYLQLAKVLKASGDDDGAAKVLVAMGDKQREGEVWRPVLKWTVGYGYRPLWAFWEVLGLTALGWILYRRSYLAGGMVPIEKDACHDFKQDGQTPNHYERFSPLIYSVEHSLPLVKLGQADKWQPDPDASGSPSRARKCVKNRGRKSWPGPLRRLERLLIFVGLLEPIDLEEPSSRFSRFGTSPRFLRWFLWAQILLGWLLATLFLAGVTGIVHKD